MSLFRVFWSVFSSIRTEYGEILRISPYSVGMQENMDQKNSQYGQFLRSEQDWSDKKQADDSSWKNKDWNHNWLLMVKKIWSLTNRCIKEHTQNIKWILMLGKILIWLILLPLALIDYISCLKFSKTFKVFLKLQFYSEPDYFSVEKKTSNISKTEVIPKCFP